MLSYLLSGLIPGCAYALLAIGITLTYKTLGVLNFAQTAIGVFGAYIGLEMVSAGIPQPWAALIGILAGAAVGVLVGAIMVAWFTGSDVQTKSSVTIVLMLGIFAAGARLFGDDPRAAPRLFPNASIEVAGIYFSMTTIIGLLLAAVISVALQVAQKKTRVGVMMSALAERPGTAQLLGVRVGMLSMTIWALTGALAALGITLIMPTRPSNFLVLSLLLLPAIAASLFGVFRSIYLALIGGLVLGMIEALATYFETLAPYRQALPFLVVLATLIWSQRKEVWDAAR
ncbi:branched-chain amino acid ABC transporter permease [Ensifer adhaerens]|uniref:branched-chain amino acid ABC transporter permease n=1 Tax=Ensifer adhaerens TaxID=106592 RepID=UPI001CBCF4E4|nr:branched-chain amino acid ABC transporter permease [Ensifer adhaerens]MBZ7924231.1 branched-chain amino acid ABC transporter permease [Ensifer adhaerens]UAX96515.1 branched-chain amino acid ABC transporter permease [Ensifer adhaerens]UAY04141.1 branched-chain amino acid ABC transporter permease [Ensifer adhaerens]UAY12127.1 branched-chain amino acid ABC transporter permease [Ensifer adhaerens]